MVVARVVVPLVAVARVGHALARALPVWDSIVALIVGRKGVILVFVAVALAAVAHVVAALAAVALAPVDLAPAGLAAAVHAAAVHAAADHVEHAVDHVDVVLAVHAAAVHVFRLVSLALLILGTSHLAHLPQVPTSDSPLNVVVFSPAI